MESLILILHLLPNLFKLFEFDFKLVKSLLVLLVGVKELFMLADKGLFLSSQRIEFLSDDFRSCKRLLQL